ncbi:MAG: hypothetical protein K2L47_01220 [Clostridia bacterium]|nr:hypothetical protein [Clostridia bacterium]
MWYDSFLSQLKKFVGVFNGASFYWGDIINGTTMAIALFVLFTISAVITLIVNGTACSEIRLARALRRIKIFAARFGVIQKGNFIHFNKICVVKMPSAVRKACVRYIFNPSVDNQTAFKRSLTRTADRSCTNGFIAYISVFGLGAVAAIATIALETFYMDGNNLWLAVSLFYGASMLIAMALQMYFISNKYKNVDIQIYSEVISRCVKESDSNVVIEKAQTKAKERPVDSIDELRRVVLGLIETGASKELLELFKDGLMSVAATNYNSTADQLRLENLVTRINNYIA